MVVKWVLIFVVPALAWIPAGRRITLLLDRLWTAGRTSLPVPPLQYDGGGFVIGGLLMTFASTNNLRSAITLTSDASNRVILSNGPQSFTLGPRTNPVDPTGRPEIDFVAESGDEQSFITSVSILPWPTPFQYKIIGGPSPWWKRYVYYRLVWKKSSGATLEMVWRIEQQYYLAGGWTKPAMMWNFQTGLVSVNIHPAAAGSR